MNTASTTRLQEDFASLSRLLSVLLGFTSLTLFADGLYMPLKALGISLYRHELGAFATFLDRVAPLLPALLLLGALWQGRRLFRQLSVGDPLSPQAAAGVRRIGEWIISAAVTGLFIGEMFSGAPGWALLAGLGAIGMALRSLAGVLDHAAAIKIEHDQIV